MDRELQTSKSVGAAQLSSHFDVVMFQRLTSSDPSSHSLISIELTFFRSSRSTIHHTLCRTPAEATEITNMTATNKNNRDTKKME
jgi:hypothetical protein